MKATEYNYLTTFTCALVFLLLLSRTRAKGIVNKLGGKGLLAESLFLAFLVSVDSK